MWVALASSTNQEGSATTTPNLPVPPWEQAKRLNRPSKTLCKGMGQAGAGYTQAASHPKGEKPKWCSVHSMGPALRLWPVSAAFPPATAPATPGQHLAQGTAGLGVDRDDTSG